MVLQKGEQKELNLSNGSEDVKKQETDSNVKQKLENSMIN